MHQAKDGKQHAASDLIHTQHATAGLTSLFNKEAPKLAKQPQRVACRVDNSFHGKCTGADELDLFSGPRNADLIAKLA